MNNIFDTHAHYSSRQFDADRAALLTALPAGGVVGVLECATHSGDAAQVLELAHAAPYFHAALGIHPEIEKQDWPRSLLMDGSKFRNAAGVGFADTQAGIKHCLREYGLE